MLHGTLQPEIQPCVQVLPQFKTERVDIPLPTIIFSAHKIDPAIARTVDAVLVKSRGSLPDLKPTLRRILAMRGTMA